MSEPIHWSIIGYDVCSSFVSWVAAILALMSVQDIIQIVLYLLIIAVMAPFLGCYIFKVFSAQKHPLSLLRPIETAIYRLGGINPSGEMGWREYALALIAFDFCGCVFVLALQLCQSFLPLNPQGYPAVPFLLALNTAVSFMTNTDWQAYAGEASLSPLVQMLGLTVQNFISAASGLAVFVVLARALVRERTDKIGNFWVDMTRGVVYILVPLSMVLALLLVSQGVVQSLKPYHLACSLEGDSLTLPVGPAASQVAIKQLGSNGGGFFGSNSAHPMENPTPFSNFLEVVAILILPVSLVFTFGRFINHQRHAFCLLCTMSLLLVAGLSLAMAGEALSPDLVTMEGQEVRLGRIQSIFWSVATTATSNGSTNLALGGLPPLSGLVCLLNMMLGEVVFGGIGSGLYIMILFVIISVFIAGLMVGRTPEYLGKKLEAGDIAWAIVGVFVSGVLAILGSAIAISWPTMSSFTATSGPHGLTELFYNFLSAAANNGSSFGGLSVNQPFYNITLAVIMFLGRYVSIFAVLAIAGNLVAKRKTAPSLGTFPTDTVAFVAILITVLIVNSALTFFPILLLGPIAEHLLMVRGVVF